MKRGLWWLAAALGATAGAPSTAAAQTAQDSLGRQVYEARCAGCHDQAKDRTPARSHLILLIRHTFGCKLEIFDYLLHISCDKMKLVALLF